MDTNNRNTKQLLIQSTKELTRVKSFSRITVEDIVDNCNMSRQTFYRNFHDKYDALFGVYEHDTEDILKQYTENKDLAALSSSIAAYLKDNETTYSNLLYGFDLPNPFFVSWSELCMNFMINHIGRKRLNTELRIAVNYFFYGSTFVNYRWLVNDLSGSPEEVGYFIVKSMPSVLKPYFQVSI